MGQLNFVNRTTFDRVGSDRPFDFWRAFNFWRSFVFWRALVFGGLLQVIKYVLEVTSVKKRFSELTVGEKDKETWPELKYTFEVKEFIWL